MPRSVPYCDAQTRTLHSWVPLEGSRRLLRAAAFAHQGLNLVGEVLGRACVTLCVTSLSGLVLLMFNILVKTVLSRFPGLPGLMKDDEQTGFP